MQFTNLKGGSTMTVRKNWLVGLLAFLFLTVNMLAAVPYQAQAASGILMNPKISDFDGTQAEVQALIHEYKWAKTKANPIVNDGYGLNGSRGGKLTYTSSEEHRIQTNDITLKKGKTYHISIWGKKGKNGVGLVPRLYLGSNTMSGTGIHNGGEEQAFEKQGGWYKNPTAVLTDDWTQCTASLTITQLNGSDSTSSVTGVEAFIMPYGHDGTSFSRNKFTNPTEFYVDGFYIIEEDSKTSTNYTRAQVANVKVAGAGEEETAPGTELTASATTGDANPNAEITLSYQWQSSEDGTTFTDIEGATEASYTVQDADEGLQIRVVATAKSTGTVSGESSMSGASSAVQVAAAAPENVTVAVSVGEGGQVMYNGAAVTGDVTIPYNSADDQIFTVVPNDGYEVASILLDEQDVTVAGNEINLKGTTAAKTLAVTFREITPVNPGIAEGATTTQFSADESGKPTMYVYSKLNSFNTAGGAEYGIKLWIKDQAENTLTLPAMLNSSDKAAAAPGQAFAIRVYGAAITADKTYVAQPYVGSENGAEEEISYK